jgi:arsenite-transporting ATPase
VGKTTLAAAAALAAAESGADGSNPVLAVSTDPAHSLGDALAARLGAEPRRVATRRGELLAAEIDAPAAFARWLAERRDSLRRLAERGSLLDAGELDRLLALPAPGVDELIGLLETARLARRLGCATTVVDTAPTAHTLRLLAMPAALRRLAGLLAAMRDRSRAIAEQLVGAAPADAADRLAEEIEAEAAEIDGLVRDPRRSALAWVLLPEPMAVAETSDAVAELSAAGIPVAELIVNRLTPPPEVPCPPCQRRRRAEAAAVAGLAERFPGLPVRALAERPREPRGAAALRAVWRGLGAAPVPRGGRRRAPAAATGLPPGPPPAWLAGLAPPGLRLLFVCGKGGVGKTTCAVAAALAAAAADPGRPVLLLSTDPAHSLADALGGALGDEPRRPPGAPENLRARELDAAAAFAAHRETLREALDELAGRLTPGGAGDRRAGIDAPFDRRLLEQLVDGIPPGLDELVTMVELTGRLDGAQELVVIDTAPTGHALRLLDAPELALAWSHALMELLLAHRALTGLGRLAEELLDLSRGARRLAEALRDPSRTRFVAVTRAAELPRRETVRLLDELGRRRLAVAALVVNALSPPGRCRRCAGRAAAERRQLDLLRRRVARGRAPGRPSAILLASAAIPPPHGAQGIARWSRRWRPDRPPHSRADPAAEPLR